MNLIEEFLKGAIAGLGMWVMMTVLGTLTFFVLKQKITRFLAKLYADFKKEVINIDGIMIEGKLKTKKKKRKNEEA